MYVALFPVVIKLNYFDLTLRQCLLFLCTATLWVPTRFGSEKGGHLNEDVVRVRPLKSSMEDAEDVERKDLVAMFDLQLQGWFESKVIFLDFHLSV